MNFHEMTGIWILEGMTPKAGTTAFMNAVVPAFGLLAHESLLNPGLLVKVHHYAPLYKGAA
jgi:hypothetical protein